MSVNYGTRTAELHGLINIPDDLLGALLGYVDIKTISLLSICNTSRETMIPFKDIRRLEFINYEKVLLEWPLLSNFTEIRTLCPCYVQCSYYLHTQDKVRILEKCLSATKCNLILEVPVRMLFAIADPLTKTKDILDLGKLLRKAVGVFSGSEHCTTSGITSFSDVSIQDLMPNLDPEMCSVETYCWQPECGIDPCISVRHSKLLRSMIDLGNSQTTCGKLSEYAVAALNNADKAREAAYHADPALFGIYWANFQYVHPCEEELIEYLEIATFFPTEHVTAKQAFIIWKAYFGDILYTRRNWDPYHTYVCNITEACGDIISGHVDAAPDEVSIAMQTWCEILEWSIHIGSDLGCDMVKRLVRDSKKFLKIHGWIEDILLRTLEYKSNSLDKIVFYISVSWQVALAEVIEKYKNPIAEWAEERANALHEMICAPWSGFVKE